MARPTRSAGPARAFVDSGVWIAYFSARDNHHAEADRLIRLAVERKVRLVTSNLVLAEVHRLLLFRAGIDPARVALELIEKSPTVTIAFADASLHREARAWLAKLGDQVISYTDATSFALMHHQRCEVVLSFDSDFTTAGFTVWKG